RGGVDAHLVVDVRPGGTARDADGADRLTTTHALALAHVERGEVPVERIELAAVIDDDEAAVARVVPGEGHLAAAGCGHGEAVARRDVDAGVHLAALAAGRHARAEGRGAREVIDRARHLSHLPTLAGDQLALVTKLRVEPSHLVAQRGAPPLGLPHLLGSNGHGEDHERGGETPTPSRARDMTRATGM